MCTINKKFISLGVLHDLYMLSQLNSITAHTTNFNFKDY